MSFVPGLPRGSKLGFLGDWYRKPRQNWKVTCYFYDCEGKPFRLGLSAEAVSFLAIGTVYPAAGRSGRQVDCESTLVFPPLSCWSTRRYGDIPASVRRMAVFADEIADQVMFRFIHGNTTYWLPAIELARALFLQTPDLVRAAVCHANTWQHARDMRHGEHATVVIPNSVSTPGLHGHRAQSLFSWLLYGRGAVESFGSIFHDMNRNSREGDGMRRWVFSFRPPDLEAYTAVWLGHTEVEDSGVSHCFIREIRSIAGVRVPGLATVTFYRERSTMRSTGTEPVSLNVAGDQLGARREVESYLKQNGSRLCALGGGAVTFRVDSEEVELRRLTKGQIALQADFLDARSNLPTLGGRRLSPGDDTLRLVSRSSSSLPDRFSQFKAMLRYLQIDLAWIVETSVGRVPRRECRSAHLIDRRPRRYIYSRITRTDGGTLHALEIELARNESLSSLFFRAKDGRRSALRMLEALMARDRERSYRPMEWKPRVNSFHSTGCLYTQHLTSSSQPSGDAFHGWVESIVLQLREFN